MKILTPRTREFIHRYSLVFEYIGSKGSGCSFDCDKDGNVDVGKLPAAALETYTEALSGYVSRYEDQKYRTVYDADGYSDYEVIPGTGRAVVYTVGKGHVVDYGAYHTTPAVGKCNHCARKVTLSSFTNTCECGHDYNMSGQELAPRSQWGEETGETAADILNPANHPDGWYPHLDDIYLSGA